MIHEGEPPNPEGKPDELQAYDEFVKLTQQLVKRITGQELDLKGNEDLAILLKFLDPRRPQKP